MLNSLDILSIASAIGSVVYLLLAAQAIWRLRSPSHHASPGALPALATYALVAFLWSIVQVVVLTRRPDFIPADLAARLPLYGLSLLALFTLSYTNALSRQRLPPAGWALVVLWLLAGVLLETGWPPGSRPLRPLMLASLEGQSWPMVMVLSAWGLWMGMAALAALRAQKRLQDPAARNRVKYMALALPLLVAGDALFMAAFWQIGGALRLAGAVVMAVAALRRRLPAIRLVVMRILADLMIVGIAAAVYALILQASAALLRLPIAQVIWPVVLLAMVLAALIQPALARLQEWLRRRVAGTRRDRNRLLRRYSQAISNVLDVQLLAALVTEMLPRYFGARRACLYLVDHEKGLEGKGVYRLRCILPPGGDEPAHGLLQENGPAAERFKQERRPLTAYDLQMEPRYNYLTSPEKAWFGQQGLEIFVPVNSKNQLIGILGLTSKNSGEAYLEDDQELLGILAAQTAVALENSRLVEGLTRLNNEFRRAYAALDQANRHLERLDRTKSDFINIASHELRTPLTVLSGYSQMMHDDPQLSADPRYARMVEGIHNGAQRLHEIVDSMLDMARIDVKDMQLNLQQVSLAELIEALKNDLASALIDRSQVLEVQNLSRLPAVEAEAEAIRKVFYHLLANAIKYTPDGGKITVTGKSLLPSPVDLPQGGVELVITDTGIGIEPRLNELIFAKFYQTGELALHSTGKTKFKGGGPGLGLAIVRGYVEAHSGKVWVESPGYDELRCPGSSFHVVLPMRQPAEKWTRRRSDNPLLDVA
jgi:signal transduction histidine kinase